MSRFRETSGLAKFAKERMSARATSGRSKHGSRPASTLTPAEYETPPSWACRRCRGKGHYQHGIECEKCNGTGVADSAASQDAKERG